MRMRTAGNMGDSPTRTIGRRPFVYGASVSSSSSFVLSFPPFLFFFSGSLLLYSSSSTSLFLFFSFPSLTLFFLFPFPSLTLFAFLTFLRSLSSPFLLSFSHSLLLSSFSSLPHFLNPPLNSFCVLLPPFLPSSCMLGYSPSLLSYSRAVFLSLFP